MNGDGVGCESCHGPSVRWLARHTTKGWKDNEDPAFKEALGFWNTKDLARRAEICAGCHIGQRGKSRLLDRDVNHDLIAAGHPRLNFEFSAYLDKQPTHWQEKGKNADPADRKKRAHDFSARAWAFGQVISAKVSLELLRERAGTVARASASVPQALPATSAPATPWPEFSEYGCFSCHHSLADEGWRRDERRSAVAAGSLSWGSWYLPVTTAFLEHPASCDRETAKDIRSVIQPIVDEMSRPVPDADVIEKLADRGALALERWIAALGNRADSARLFDAATVEQLVDFFDRRVTWERVTNWDEAAQRYLALVPLRQAWVELAPGRKDEQDRLKTRLERVRSKLQFPEGFDSPKGFDPGKLRRAGDG
jgi:hypothetical protein